MFASIPQPSSVYDEVVFACKRVISCVGGGQGGWV